MLTKVGLFSSQGVRALHRNSTKRCYGMRHTAVQCKEFRNSTYARKWTGNPPT